MTTTHDYFKPESGEQYQRPAPRRNRGKQASSVDFEAIKEAAEPYLLEILESLAPEGERRGEEYVMLNPRRPEDCNLGSFKFNIDSQAWADFAADDEARGGDITSLVAYLHQVSSTEAAKGLAKFIAARQAEGAAALPGHELESRQRTGRRTTPLRDTGEPIIPVPVEAGPMDAAMASAIAYHGEHQGTWTYRNERGDPVCHVVRIGTGVGKKEFRPVTYRSFKDGASKWAFGGIDKDRPLYNLVELASRREDDVMIVEGEKAADAVKSMLPSFVVTTTMHGSQSPQLTDLRPLNGRTVWIWPDADEAGERYAKKVKDLLRKADPIRQIHILPRFTFSPGLDGAGEPTLVEGFDPPQGWDGADAATDGWTEAHLRLVLERATARPYVPVLSHDASVRVAMQPILPPAVQGVIDTFGGNLVYYKQQFYTYRDGYWPVLDEDAHIKNAVARFYGADAVAKQVNGTFSLLQAFQAVDEIFTPDREKICMRNGTFNLQTFQLEEHSPANALLNRLNVVWDPAAACPRWLQFLEETFGPDSDKAEKIAFLQQWFGYCLTTDVSQHKFVWLVGSGGNGKSVILNVLRELVGPQNVSGSSIGSFNNAFFRAELEGKLLNISAEMSAEDTVSDGYLKQIVVGDLIDAARKFKKPFSFRPFAKIMASTNMLPRLLDLSNGFTRRAVILSFNRVLAEAEMDPQLETKLLNELSGIAAWAIEGLRQLRAAGRFIIPSSSSDAVNAYRREADAVALFVDEVLERVVDGGSTATELYQPYKIWARENGFSEMNRQTLGKRLTGLGYTKHRVHRGDIYPLQVRDTYVGAAAPVRIATEVAPVAASAGRCKM